MTTLKREVDVIIHGQPLKFRIIKYSVLIPLFVLVYLVYGLNSTVWLLIILLIAVLILHLFYRGKTSKWTKSWGGYKAK